MVEPGHGAAVGRAGHWPWVMVACHALGLLVFPSPMPTISDELHYVHEAVLFARGTTRAEAIDPISEGRSLARVSPYAPGTSLLLTPFVAALGQAGAPWLGWLSLALMVWATGRLIALLRGPPGASVLVAVFLPIAVLCRHAMSDLPSGALISVSMLLFFSGAASPPPFSANASPGPFRPRWFFSGFLAGASVLLREANPLLLAPLFAGALVRRERGVASLVVGGVLGLALRPIVMQLLFGDPAYVKSYPGFSPENLPSHLPFYLAIGTFLLPAGVPAALSYRGPRRPELLATTALWLLFLGCYDYAGEPSGFAKALILGGRFLIPIVPLWTLAIALVVPGWLATAIDRRAVATAIDHRAVTTATQAMLAGLVLALHAVMGQWSATQAAMRDAVYAHTPKGALIVPLPGTSKLINPLYGDRTLVPMQRVVATDGTLLALLAEEDLYVVELQRRDSEQWRRLSAFNETLRKAVTTLGPSEQVFELRATATDHLVIWRVGNGRTRHP